MPESGRTSSTQTPPEDQIPPTILPQPAVGAGHPETARVGNPVRPPTRCAVHYQLQYLDMNGLWREWCAIPPEGKVIGRGQGQADLPGGNTLAVRHLRFTYEHAQLIVEDAGSLNGVFLRVGRPIDLRDGMRFRVGNHVLEFRLGTRATPEPPLLAADGEEFWSRELEVIAQVDLIRPNGRPGLRFPIGRRDLTIIGREGAKAALVLDDNWVSGAHAQIRQIGDRFLLEDLNSRNGTYVKLPGATPLVPGDTLMAGRVLLRVIIQP